MDTLLTFTPSRPVTRCPTFGPVHKVAILLVMGFLTFWGLELALNGSLRASTPVLWFASAYVMLLYMSVILFRSHTTLTPEALSQDWFWRKSTPLHTIEFVRFFRVKGWEWLIAPRLYVRAGTGPFRAYYVYGADMWQELEAWSAHMARKAAEFK